MVRSIGEEVVILSFESSCRYIRVMIRICACNINICRMEKTNSCRMSIFHRVIAFQKSGTRAPFIKERCAYFLHII